MRKFAILGLLFSTLILIGGCGIVEMILGVKTEKVDIVEKVEVVDPETGEKKIIERIVGTEERKVPTEGPSPLELILGLIVPGAAGLAATARWGYVESHNKKVVASMKAAVAGVDGIVSKIKSGESISKEDMYRLITVASETYANRDFFKNFVDRVKKEIRATKAVAES